MSIKKLYIQGREWSLNLDKGKNKKTSPKKSKKIVGDSVDAMEKELWEFNHGFNKSQEEQPSPIEEGM